MISNRLRKKYNAGSARRKKIMAVNLIKQEVGCVCHPIHTVELSAESLKKIHGMWNKHLDELPPALDRIEINLPGIAMI